MHEDSFLLPVILGVSTHELSLCTACLEQSCGQTLGLEHGDLSQVAGS